MSNKMMDAMGMQTIYMWLREMGFYVCEVEVQQTGSGASPRRQNTMMPHPGYPGGYPGGGMRTEITMKIILENTDDKKLEDFQKALRLVRLARGEE